MSELKLSAEQMYRNAKRGWFYCLIGVIWPTIFAFLFRSDLRNFDISQPFITGDNKIVVTVALIAAITIFVGALYLKNTLTKKAILEQNRELVLKGYIYGLQASGLIVMIAVLLAIFSDYHYFYLWSVFALFNLMIYFPRKQPFFDASYKTL